MKALHKKIKKTLRGILPAFAAVLCLGLSDNTPFEIKAMAAEAVPPAAEQVVTVSDNSVPAVSDNSVPVIPEAELPAEVEIAEEAEEPVLLDPDQMQSINYKQEALVEWAQITEALKNLTPDSLTNPDIDNKTLVLQLQNVKSIPVDVKDAVVTSDGSGYNKILQCNLGYGVDLVLNGAEDNSGFLGIANTNVVVASESRGKKSVATTVKFDSHQSLGTVAGLQLNLPRCAKGTKVSVYAETVTMDAQGNPSAGENVCIGNTKADDIGNVAVPIQSTANYMFVYKGEKE